MRFTHTLSTVALTALFVAVSHAAPSPLPAKPAEYVLDETGVLSSDERRALSEELEQFEHDTSNQIVVAVMPRVPDDYVMEDFTQRTAEAWGSGRKDRDNGIVLFVFPEQREMRIEVGYGLEGAVPDALANRIIQDEMVPSFRAGDMPGGIARGVQALMAATTGEYTGADRTEGEIGGEALFNLIIVVIFLILVVISIRRSQTRGGHVYDTSGRRDVWFPSSGSGLGGGGFSGGFGGGGFSGGGGGFGGGGASGRW